MAEDLHNTYPMILIQYDIYNIIQVGVSYTLFTRAYIKESMLIIFFNFQNFWLRQHNKHQN